MLVTCNCRVLRLYTSPRSNKNRKGNYHNLKDGEGGRYGVISVTNPNYEEAAVNLDDNESLVKFGYKEDIFTERTEFKETSSLESAMNGELTCSLSVDELPKGPPPHAV